MQKTQTKVAEATNNKQTIEKDTELFGESTPEEPGARSSHAVFCEVFSFPLLRKRIGRFTR